MLTTSFLWVLDRLTISIGVNDLYFLEENEYTKTQYFIIELVKVIAASLVLIGGAVVAIIKVL